MAEQQFVSGLYAKPRAPKAPDYVVCGLSAHREELIAWLEQQEAEWIYMQVKISKAGDKFYVAIDPYEKGSAPKKTYQEPDRSTWSPSENTPDEDTIEYPPEDFNPNDIPF